MTYGFGQFLCKIYLSVSCLYRNFFLVETLQMLGRLGRVLSQQLFCLRLIKAWLLF